MLVGAFWHRQKGIIDRMSLISDISDYVEPLATACELMSVSLIDARTDCVPRGKYQRP